MGVGIIIPSSRPADLLSRANVICTTDGQWKSENEGEKKSFINLAPALLVYYESNAHSDMIGGGDIENSTNNTYSYLAVISWCLLCIMLIAGFIYRKKLLCYNKNK